MTRLRAEASPLSRFKVGSLPVGQKAILDYNIGAAPDGSEWGLSILVARGAKAGPTLLLTGGTHGDEYEGPVAIQELFDELDPAQISGNWLGIPVLNEPAMSVPQRCGRFDNQDLARVFPGKAEGTLTERIAYQFGQFVLSQANYYADLHSGGSVFRMVTLAGYSMVANLELLQKQRAMAKAFGADLIWGTPSMPGRTTSQSEALQIPTIYVETTGTGGAKREDIERYKQGIHNLMKFIGMLEGDVPSRPMKVRENADANSNEGFLQIEHPAPCKGLFVPWVDLWDKVEAGQEVGKIVDSAGRTLSPVHARRSGYVILIRHWLSVNEQDPLMVVIEDLQTG
jgi:predicted deacylase